MGGWQAYSVHKPEELAPVNKSIQPASYALSTLGMPGLTAYAGLILKAQPKPEDVVLVPAATGAVGSVVGQLAKIYGCKTIGIAGNNEKCRYAKEQLGYDECINRKTEDLAERLKALCPDGVNIYFDLIGGEMLNVVSNQLAIGARIILCGLMAEYNSSTRMAGPPPGLWIVARANVHGLVVYDYEGQRDDFISECLPYVQDGRLKVKEDIYNGLSSAPNAFCRLMRGDNMGKVVVKVNE
jgi:NADPH-dependent curcumin reductase CurA